MASEKVRLTKADMDARFTARQERNRNARATKLTGEDLEARLKDRRSAKLPRPVNPGRRSKRISVMLGGVLLLGSAVVALSASASADEFRHATETTNAQIAAAQGDLRAMPTADDQGASNFTAQLDAQLGEAASKAEVVAALQQGFADILYRGNGETTANGAPSAAFLESVEHRRQLAPYFVAKALIADDALAYAPGSALPFGDGEIDPRFPWYTDVEPGSNGRIIADPSTSSWSVAAVVSSGTPGVIEVTWLDTRTETGELLAWATASYYADSGAFGGLVTGQTTIGERGSAGA
ncbi:hypothetical protein SAMN06295974_3696 [Plantibacter flavus]|uniref:Uncharacterized protein n=1 Tax=Plantibacter flavus TaxID=150123 RepID=A0A3N2BL40_9MICO|nr:hypothetical protein [Plantibacter flavus]ROR75969.1 hypothetical protein EDD42_3920 [Plantibacter flavus]SMG48220.1 hypothetical protein SAMN06295974_3696 [Plantibacter flavus]